jgi:calcineurin-like phosphoesterase family protein
MSIRYFTSDFHFGSSVLLDKNAMGKDARPFSDLDSMHLTLQNAIRRAGEDDVLIHLGDLAGIGKDRQWYGLKNESELIQMLKVSPCQKIFIEGNHDKYNAKIASSASRLLVDRIGRQHTVTLQHYPSWHSDYCFVNLPTNLKFNGIPTWINICGHVHNAWKVYYDYIRHILNINVGVDRNKFKIYSETELAALISRAVEYMKSLENGEHQSYDEWDKALRRRKADNSRDKLIRSAIYLRDHKPHCLNDRHRKILESLET